MSKAFISFLVLCFISFGALSQEVNHSIVDEINTERVGEGIVQLMQDESINIKSIASYRTGDNFGYGVDREISVSDDHVKIRGWRIQVFSGNHQTQSKRDAESRKAMVNRRFPKLGAAITYNAPVWRLRVGNFASRNEAEQVLEDMKKALPSLAREMYLVQDVVEIPVE